MRRNKHVSSSPSLWGRASSGKQLTGRGLYRRYFSSDIYLNHDCFEAARNVPGGYHEYAVPSMVVLALLSAFGGLFSCRFRKSYSKPTEYVYLFFLRAERKHEYVFSLTKWSWCVRLLNTVLRGKRSESQDRRKEARRHKRGKSDLGVRGHTNGKKRQGCV